MRQTTYTALCTIIALMICIALFSSVIFASGQGKIKPLGGKEFKSFAPDATAIRDINYLSSDGKLNTIVIVGARLSAIEAVGVAELTARMAELLQSVNSTAGIDNIVNLDEEIQLDPLKEKTVILVGNRQTNTLIEKIVAGKKSKIDWRKTSAGMIEVIQSPFGGDNKGIIVGGSTKEGTYSALLAYAGWFARKAAAHRMEDGLLMAEKRIAAGELQAAIDAVEKIFSSLERVKNTSVVYIPVREKKGFEEIARQRRAAGKDVVEACKKKPNACVKEFSKERKAAAKEVIVACKKGDRSTAYQAWRNLATICWHCHIGFPVPYHDRYAQNRTKFHHAQYPGIDVKTKPDRIDPTNPVCANCHAK